MLWLKGKIHLKHFFKNCIWWCVCWCILLFGGVLLVIMAKPWWQDVVVRFFQQSYNEDVLFSFLKQWYPNCGWGSLNAPRINLKGPKDDSQDRKEKVKTNFRAHNTLSELPNLCDFSFFKVSKKIQINQSVQRTSSLKFSQDLVPTVCSMLKQISSPGQWH